MKVKKFHEGIFNVHLLFVYDCKASEAQEYLRKNNIYTNLVAEKGETGKYIVKRNKDWEQERYYIYLEKSKNDITPILLHELCHLVFFALRDCGIEIHKDNDEIVAYYLEYWFNKLKKSI